MIKEQHQSTAKTHVAVRSRTMDRSDGLYDVYWCAGWQLDTGKRALVKVWYLEKLDAEVGPGDTASPKVPGGEISRRC